MSKTILITGATDGIGRAAAKQLAEQGHHLLLAGRNPDKLTAVAQEARSGGASEVETFQADFESLQSVRKLAQSVLDSVDRLDVLVNNAGTVYDDRTTTGDDLEATFQVNHLGSFVLTEALKDLLVASAPSRIVFTSSAGHYQGTMDLEDPGFGTGGYTIMRAYNRSKLANVLYARSLARELKDKGVTVNALHPGAVSTGIWSGAPRWARPLLAVAKLFMVSPDKGGARIVRLATDPDLEGTTGLYFQGGSPKRPAELALDDALGERLRQESARLTGVASG
jgi:NAD(P)-dependent dehydrogenase (short-subunit alcohol dehydrogenase family)